MSLVHVNSSAWGILCHRPEERDCGLLRSLCRVANGGDLACRYRNRRPVQEGGGDNQRSLELQDALVASRLRPVDFHTERRPGLLGETFRENFVDVAQRREACVTT